MDKAAPDPLKAIRSRIDAVDEKMHRLLIERASVIAELIQVKGTSKPAAAFRPEREADMMRRLAARHEGGLPLHTVEHIWREIITTFTAMQAPFAIAAGPAADPLKMRDLIRFYFGFSVPIRTCASAAEAIMRVADSGQEIAIVALESGERWWGALEAPAAPKVFAKLPFLEISSRPDLPAAYVIGPPLKEQPAFDTRIFALSQVDAAGLVPGGSLVAGQSGGGALVELPSTAKLDGRQAETARPLGGFFRPIRIADQKP
jgi:chorismate mutase-like protein